MVMKLERRRQVVVLSDEEWLAEHRRAGSKRSRADLLRQKRVREELPYGMFVRPDGGEVLFNREYWPIWQRERGGRGRPANRAEWVVWIEFHVFYEPGGRRTDPWLNEKVATELGELLHEFRRGGLVTRQRLWSQYRAAPTVVEAERSEARGGMIWRSEEDKAQAERVVGMVRRRVVEVEDLAVLARELAGEGIAPGHVEWLLMAAMVEVGAVHVVGGRERCLRQIMRGLWLAKQ
jgi:hypothetical protein